MLASASFKNALRYKRFVVAFIITAQLAVLGYMAFEREAIIKHGQRVFLRTAPVDPRDPFRGDYVRLGYALNQVSQQQYQGRKPQGELKRAQRVYASLAHSGNNVYELEYLSDRPPSQPAMFIAGRNTTSPWTQNNRNYLDIKYGIEKYFVEQGKGKKLEQKLGRRNQLQIPMEVEIALGSKGTAVIIGHRWSPLGIQLEFDTPPEGSAQTTSPVVTFIIENVSDTQLTLANAENQCSFVAQVRSQGALLQHSPEDCETPKSTASITLEPEGTMATTIDFNDPRWHITDPEGTRKPVHLLTGWNQVQLIYQPPVLEGTWEGNLRSPRFTANRRVD